MQKEDTELITSTINAISKLSEQSDETLNEITDNASDNFITGAALMIGGAMLTPVCTALGAGVMEFGYGYTIGSTVVGGLASWAKILK